jgi:hypothetical protein
MTGFRFEAYSAIIVRRWSIIDGETLMSMSFKQFVSFQIFGKSDTVFQAASDAEVADVVVIGLLKYAQSRLRGWFEPCCFFALLAEAVLYCDWIHVGTAEVQQITDVLIAHPELFQRE